jgi:hypothetical protein
MKPRKDLVLLGTLATVLSGCEVPGFCTLEVLPAIEVTVVDDETGAPAAEGVVGLVFDGTYSDSLHLGYRSSTGDWLGLRGAYERPGDYLIVLRKPGYRDWVMSHVRVGEDACHVLTRTVVARLQRAP